MEQAKKVFVSYSWDSPEHQKWVVKLTNQLRKEGINATIDVFQTQSKTVNLNTMMVSNMKDNDFIIVVLTEKYAQKANSLQGGVGFETVLSLPILQKDPSKLIFILRHHGNFEGAFPFHLDGYYAIDFSNNQKFDEKFKELLHRISGVPLYEMEPIGKQRVLNTISVDKTDSLNGVFSDLEIPNLKSITDKDIKKFMKESFHEINQLLDELFTLIQNENPNFEYDKEDITNYKTIFTLYLNGEIVVGVKVWCNNDFGSDTINFSYGRNISLSRNSSNEVIMHDIDEKKQLKLKMTMNFMTSINPTTPEDIVKEIWRNNLAYYFK